MEPGSSLLVNLPTGSGKSLVEGAGALLRARDQGGVSVVVVPTISLGQDQERAMFENAETTVLPERLAYFGTQSDQERQGIRQRIREGTQTVVFASPESILNSLLPSIYTAARKGLLRYFVIDEAHTVASWGAEFRPEFQSLAGLRLGLLDACRENGHELFRTLLMSATLSVDSLRLLRRLFGDPAPFHSVIDPVLRPEPEFWIAGTENREDQRRYVLEALSYLPRPLVVYSTLPEESKLLRDLAGQMGYLRTGVVTGATPPAARAEVMARWRGESPTDDEASTDIDIVFATSAFGLGVDFTGVRSVVHACIPETLDRFYQEVGRGGRDGRPSLSLLVHAPEDREVATSLNKNLLIGPTKGKGRWETMLARSTEVTSEPLRIKVDLRTLPSWLQRTRSENEAWNLRTLLLMSRAGLLMLDAQPPPTTPAPETADKNESAEAFESYFSEQVVRLLQPDHMNEQVWAHVIGDVRSKAAFSDQTQLKLMFEALDAETDFAELFARAYETGNTSVQPSCGGCPDCRRRGRRPYVGLGTFPAAIPTHVPFSAGLDQIASEGDITFVTHGGAGKGKARERWLRDRLDPLIFRLVGQGLLMIRADSDLLRRPPIRNVHEKSLRGFVFSQELGYDSSVIEAPTLVIADLDRGSPPEDLSWACSGKPLHPRLVLIREDQADPLRPTRRLVETRARVVSLVELLRML
jgi:ATP-dependent DNA helicase RecQ